MTKELNLPTELHQRKITIRKVKKHKVFVFWHYNLHPMKKYSAFKFPPKLYHLEKTV